MNEKPEVQKKWNPFRPPKYASAKSSKAVSMLTILTSEFLIIIISV